MVRHLALLAFAFLLAAPAAASAHGEGLETAIGATDGHTPSGLYRVVLDDGAVLFTHGGDPKADHGTNMEAGDPELAPVCATTNAQQVLYAYTKRSGNRLVAVKASLQAQIRRNTYVLNESSINSGGVGARYKVTCDGGGISVLAYLVKAGTSFSQITNAARQAGHKRTDVDYTIFFDGTSATACGVGSYYADDTPLSSNLNNRGGGYGVSYGDCWFGRTSMHENGHNQGAVQAGALHSTGSGAHCNDLLDVMCYAPDGGNQNQTTVTLCPTVMWFDCNHDTYYDAGPVANAWLASHWNLGSAANNFISRP